MTESAESEKELRRREREEPSDGGRRAESAASVIRGPDVPRDQDVTARGQWG